MTLTESRIRTAPLPSLVRPEPTAEVVSEPPGWRAHVPTALAVVAANIAAFAGGHPQFLAPALVFWLMVVLPAYLLTTTRLTGEGSIAERAAYGLVGAILLLLVGGLAMNTLLPVLGVARPLSTIPVLVLVDVLDVGLWLVRRRQPAYLELRSIRGRRTARQTRELRVLVLAACCPVLLALGANRVNNGDGSALTMCGLALALVTVATLLLWSDRLRASVIGGAVYLLSLGLLLMTSLRGWSITGHDIQLEYRVFQLTAAHGKWAMSNFRNPYTACLSITLLPAQMAALLHVDDPYVFKVFFQLMFAMCPVMVFVIARRYFSVRVALLGAVYFVGFPTFFTDMPFLNRQEMALLFVAAAVLVMTNPHWSKRRRQVLLIVGAVGVELCHYSTSYVFFAVLAVAWLGQTVLARGWPPVWTRTDPSRAARRRWKTSARTLGAGCLVVLLAVIVAWGGLATGSADGAPSQIASAVSGIFGHSSGSKSSSVSYGLFGGASDSKSQNDATGVNQALLDQYRAQTLSDRSKAAPGTFIPLSVVDRFSTPVVSQPSLPVTKAGRLLADAHVSPAIVNDAMRTIAAKGEQVFLLIGMVALLFSRRRRGTVGREYFFLGVGSIAALVAVTVLPDLSVEYGVLRVFQQALIVLAPVIVVGSLTLFQPLGRWWRQVLTGAVGLAIFASTTGLIPEALGGYPAQLNLNNSGQYYDLYYMTPGEVAAVNWLAGKPGTLPGGVQAEYTSERFAFTSPSSVSGQQYLTDIYPTVVQRTSWVVADASMLKSGTASVFVSGNLISYRYPFALLHQQKNLVFDDGQTQIYQ